MVFGNVAPLPVLPKGKIFFTRLLPTETVSSDN